MLQQWNIQINIPPILEINHKLIYVSGKNILRYYKGQLPTSQVEQEQATTAANISNTPKTLLLKLFTDKPVWVVQWPLTTE